MFSASIENRGDSRCFAQTRGAAFVMDTEGRGANPIDTLLASLAGCLNHQLRDFFRDDGITSNGFAVRAVADLTEDKARLASIRVTINLKDTNVARESEAKLMGYVEACKIFRTLSANSKITAVLERRP